jgi:hypothetical protein
MYKPPVIASGSKAIPKSRRCKRDNVRVYRHTHALCRSRLCDTTAKNESAAILGSIKYSGKYFQISQSVLHRAERDRSHLIHQEIRKEVSIVRVREIIRELGLRKTQPQKSEASAKEKETLAR